MERLTQTGFNLCDTCGDRANCNHLCDSTFPECGEKAIYDRLAAYEDIGLAPEKHWEIAHAIREFDMQNIYDLLAAERDNKLVTMQISPGVVVWYIDKYDTYPEGARIVRGNIDGIIIRRRGDFLLNIAWERPIKGHFGYMRSGIKISDIGKTAFFTREEAEAALKAQKGES